MVDELKIIRDNFLKALTGKSGQTGTDAATSADEDDDDEENEAAGSLLDASQARALIGALFSRAGKSKDEIVQIVAREIGVAVAAMLKEPLSQLAEHRKLQISFEFVPKDGKTDGDEGAQPPPRKPATRKPRRGSKS